jgi:hypothetical protein
MLDRSEERVERAAASADPAYSTVTSVVPPFTSTSF